MSWDYVGTEPNERFPIYTRGNAGEVYPQVVYPLSFTLAFEESLNAYRRASLRSGVAVPRDFHGPSVNAGVFGGYVYINLSFARVMFSRIPGADMEQVDRQFLGTSDAPPYRPDPHDRSLIAGFRALLYIVRTLLTRELPALRLDELRVASWRAAQPDAATATDAQLRGVIASYQDLDSELFETHLWISGMVATPMVVLGDLCEQWLGDRDMVRPLMVGIGDVASAAPSQALWGDQPVVGR